MAAAYQGRYTPTNYKNPLQGGLGVLGGDVLAEGTRMGERQDELVDEARKAARAEAIRKNQRAYQEGVLTEERKYKEGKEEEAESKMLDPTTPAGMKFKADLESSKAKTAKTKAEEEYYRKGKGKDTEKYKGKLTDTQKDDLKQIDLAKEELKESRLNLDPKKDAEQIADINKSLAALDLKRRKVKMDPKDLKAYEERVAALRAERDKAKPEVSEEPVAKDKPKVVLQPERKPLSGMEQAYRKKQEAEGIYKARNPKYQWQIDSLSNALETGDLTAVERKAYLERIKEVAEKK